MNHATPRIRATLLALVLATGCTAFSDLEPPDEHHEEDAGDGHGHGGPADEVEIDDVCHSEVPALEPSETPRALVVHEGTDTVRLEGICELDAALDGPDGFFRIDSAAGQLWHIAVHPTHDDQDVAVFVLRTCDERSCEFARDVCGPGRAEELSFVPPTAGTYYVGVDTSELAPVRASIHSPRCGDGVAEHGEGCDDGNTAEGDGCDALCRPELVSGSDVEIEPNDDGVEANMVRFAAEGLGTRVLRGDLGDACDVDVFGFEVPEGASLEVVALGPAGAPCEAGPASMELSLVSGRTGERLGRGRAQRAGGECPSIEADDAFAQTLSAGEYRVRLRADAQTRTDYRLRVRLHRDAP